MYSLGDVLTTDVDFDNALFFGLVICITSNGIHLGSSWILSHNTKNIRTLTGNYAKEHCEFKVVYNTAMEKQLKMII